MARQPETERSFSSTRWIPEVVKIKPPARATQAARRSRTVKALMRPWEPREKLNMRIVYRGGAEAWFEIDARGETWRFTGACTLYDAMAEIYRRK